MKVHISLNVKDVEQSVDFYTRMFQTQPMKHIKRDDNGTTGYAKFDLSDPNLNLVLNERAVTPGGRLSHLGIQVNSTDEVLKYKDLWSKAGFKTDDEIGVTCCYAKQDKTWITDPDGNEWEAFVVLEDVESMNADEAGCCDVTAGPVSISTAKSDCSSDGSEQSKEVVAVDASCC